MILKRNPKWKLFMDGYESEVKYYDEKGNIYRSRTYNNKEGKYEGTIIEYYYAPMRIASIERYNKKGDLLESKSYIKWHAEAGCENIR